MPSISHRLVARAVPILRRSREVTDPARTRRDVLAGQGRSTPVPRPRALRGLTLGQLDGHGFPVFDVRAPGTPTGTLLYLHGGGFVSGIDRYHWRYVVRLARATGRRVVLPDYPLAPGATWLDAHAPLLGLFEQLAVESPHGVALAGDSAGGGLALALAQHAAAGAGPQPTALLLVAPWVDLAGTTPGTEEMRGRDRWLMLSKLRLYGSWWAGDDDVERAEVSPLYGSFAGLPPMLVLCGTRDLLLPQVRAMVGRARADGVEVTYREAEDLVHIYPILPVREAGPALDAAAVFLTGRVG